MIRSAIRALLSVADERCPPTCEQRSSATTTMAAAASLRVGQDFSLLAAAINLQRLATLKARAPG